MGRSVLYLELVTRPRSTCLVLKGSSHASTSGANGLVSLCQAESSIEHLVPVPAHVTMPSAHFAYRSNTGISDSWRENN